MTLLPLKYSITLRSTQGEGVSLKRYWERWQRGLYFTLLYCIKDEFVLYPMPLTATVVLLYKSAHTLTGVSLKLAVLGTSAFNK